MRKAVSVSEQGTAHTRGGFGAVNKSADTCGHRLITFFTAEMKYPRRGSSEMAAFLCLFHSPNRKSMRGRSQRKVEVHCICSEEAERQKCGMQLLFS